MSIISDIFSGKKKQLSKDYDWQPINNIPFGRNVYNIDTLFLSSEVNTPVSLISNSIKRLLFIPKWNKNNAYNDSVYYDFKSFMLNSEDIIFEYLLHGIAVIKVVDDKILKNRQYKVIPHSQFSYTCIWNDVTEKWDVSLYGIDTQNVYLFIKNYPVSNIIDSNIILFDNLRSSLEARNNILVKRGALGVLYNDAVQGNTSAEGGGMISMKKTEIDNIKRGWENYGVTGNRDNIMFVNHKTGYHQIAQTVKDMELFREYEENCKALYNLFLVPSVLIPSMNQGTTFANMDSAYKFFYNESVIPLMEKIVSFYLSIVNFDGYIDISTKNIPEIQTTKRNEDLDFYLKMRDNGLITNEDIKIQFDIN